MKGKFTYHPTFSLKASSLTIPNDKDGVKKDFLM
jgi:hypothetical protein